MDEKTSQAKYEEQQKSLFRQSSLDRISSPEDLNDYVRVTNPGVWMILIGIIVLLLGFVAWGIWGNISTTVDGFCLTENGRTMCYVSEQNVGKIAEGMSVFCEGEEYKVASVSQKSFEADSVLSDYDLHVSEFENGEWIHLIELDRPASEGAYKCSVVIEKLNPISFIIDN